MLWPAMWKIPPQVLPLVMTLLAIGVALMTLGAVLLQEGRSAKKPQP